MSKENFIFQEQLNDFKAVFQRKKRKKDIMKKYGISENTYAKYKKRFILNYNIDPFELYDTNSILMCPEILDFCVKKGLLTEEFVLESERNGKIVNRQTPKHIGLSKWEREKGFREINYSPKENHNEDLYLVKGKSTLIDEDGKVKLQWVKESLDEKAYYNSLKKAIEKLCVNIPSLSEKNKIYMLKPFKDNINNPLVKNRMVFLPLADMHLGLHIDKNSVNHKSEWNLDIAEKVFYESSQYILNTLPQAESIVIADLGDLTHNHNNDNKTAKSGHSLDVDGRYETIMLKAFEMMISLVYSALKKYNKVYFYSTPGNHNDMISTPLKCVIKHHFRNDGRVIVDVENYSNVYYHYFGKNLLMFHHGDEVKPNFIESVIFADNLDKISNFKNFDAWLGHYHTEKQQQRGLVTIRYVKNFIPNDRWSNNASFRNSRNVGYMCGYVYDKEQGIISSISYNPSSK